MRELVKSLTENKDVITAWTAIAAVCISFSSIIFTTVNMFWQRAHNRKSVLPIGYLSFGDYENKIFVRLRNDGVGPLIVKKIVAQDVSGDRGDCYALIDSMPELPKGVHWTTFTRDITGRALSAGKAIDLVLLEGDPHDQKFASAREVVRRALSSLIVRIDYKDVYGTSMSYERALDWFARDK